MNALHAGRVHPQLASLAGAVSQSGFVPGIKMLVCDEWLTLRDIRLAALQESPPSFLSTYEQEKAYGEHKWRAELTRGNWNIGILEDRPVSLLGDIHVPGMPAHERYFEYLWVAPECRRSGVALGMLTIVLDRLQASGVRTVFLWVLDGNDAAIHLYKRVGFVSDNHRQPLAAHPGRSEERMRLDLDQWPRRPHTAPSIIGE
jgi:ribosomal protein S18 acetylase RimI-like enzyme